MRDQRQRNALEGFDSDTVFPKAILTGDFSVNGIAPLPKQGAVRMLVRSFDPEAKSDGSLFGRALECGSSFLAIVENDCEEEKDKEEKKKKHGGKQTVKTAKKKRKTSRGENLG